MAYHKAQYSDLFLFLYINDIVFVSDIGLTNIIMFADDISLFFSGSDFNCMSALINQELIKISD